MHSEIIIAGFGGQGVLFVGKLIAVAGMRTGRQVSWFPSYGPEMRGGTANCHVVVSDDEVACPMVCNPNVLISMNAPSWEKFSATVAEDGIALYDSSLITAQQPPSNAFAVPATQMAFDMDAKTLANMIMAGALCKKSGFVSLEQLCDACEYVTPKSKPQLLEMNLSAIKAGYDYLK